MRAVGARAGTVPELVCAHCTAWSSAGTYLSSLIIVKRGETCGVLRVLQFGPLQLSFRTDASVQVFVLLLELFKSP